jgi:hypothetical protein
LIYNKTLISPYGHPGWEIAYWDYPKGKQPANIIDAFGKRSALNGVAVSVSSQDKPSH